MLVMIGVRSVGHTLLRERQHGSLAIGLKEIRDARHDSIGRMLCGAFDPARTCIFSAWIHLGHNSRLSSDIFNSSGIIGAATLQSLKELCGFADPKGFRRVDRQSVEQRLESGLSMRDDRWSDIDRGQNRSVY